MEVFLFAVSQDFQHYEFLQAQPNNLSQNMSACRYPRMTVPFHV